MTDPFDPDNEFILGLRKGESVLMERHGEMGRLYRPIVHLGENEMRLLAAFSRATEKDLNREEGVALIEMVASKTIADELLRANTIENVIAYFDELNMRDPAGKR